jgi:glycine/sarcosine/betaine reductase complex component A
MDLENQAAIKKLVEEIGVENVVVIFGMANMELAEIAARTMMVGDPSFTGPLAGVSLRLPVYHILEPEVKEAIPAEVYAKQAGFMEMVVDTEEISRKFREIRNSAESV